MVSGAVKELVCDGREVGVGKINVAIRAKK